MKNIFIRFVLLLCILPTTGLQAQFTGGSGDGDSSFTISNLTLSGESITLYFGGSGDGDQSAIITSVFFSEDVLFQGGDGKGDVAYTTDILAVGDDVRFAGGAGRGESSDGFTEKVVSQRILWIGGGGVGNDSASDQTANWFPNTIPHHRTIPLKKEKFGKAPFSKVIC